MCVFSSQTISRFNDVVWDLNLKAQFLHLVEELDVSSVYGVSGRINQITGFIWLDQSD